MTLRDEIAAVLGPGNDDATAYAQADYVLEVLQKWHLAHPVGDDLGIAPTGKMHWATVVDEDLVDAIEVHKPLRRMSDAEIEDRLGQLRREQERRHGGQP